MTTFPSFQLDIMATDNPDAQDPNDQNPVTFTLELKATRDYQPHFVDYNPADIEISFDGKSHLTKSKLLYSLFLSLSLSLS